MSIKDQQIKTATDSLILSELKSGKVPSSYTIQERIEKLFNGRLPGTPEFVSYEVEKFDVSNKEAFNKAMYSLSNDLTICFKELIRINDEVVNIFEYYEAQKGNIAAEIEKLSLQLLASETQSEGIVKVINFKHFYESNFTKNDAINLPSTTAFIDIQERAVYLQKVVSLCNKVDIDKADITITPSHTLSIERKSGNDKSLISDIGNDPIQIIGKSSNEKDEFITIEITLPESKEINTVMLASKSYSKCKMAVKLSNDDQSFKLLGKRTSNGDMTWSFEPYLTKKIIMTITKTEAEGFMDEQFLYMFILENISIKLETYQEESVHVTEMICQKGVLDYITLSCTENIPTGTSIEHYVGVKNKGPINWVKIDQHIPTSLGLMYPNTIVSKKDTVGYGMPIGSRYAIALIEPYVDQSNINVYPGYQMFKKQVIKPVDDLFDIKSIKEGKVLSIDYINCETYQVNAADKEVIYLSQYVQCDETIIIDKKFIQNANGVMVFLNNVAINDLDGKYSLKLLKGVNKVEIYIASKGLEIIHNFNMKTASFMIHAERPLKSGSLFAVDKTTGVFSKTKEGFLIVKDDVTSLSTMPTGIRFKIDYKCPKEPLMKETKFAIMSIIRSKDKNITPKMYDQSIVMR